MIKLLSALWVTLLCLTLGREWLLANCGISSSAMGAWLGWLGLAMLPFTVRWSALTQLGLGWQRAISGGMALLGIYGAIQFLGAPLAVAIILCDTIILYRHGGDRKSGWLLFACIGLFVAQAAFNLRLEPNKLLVGGLWAGLAIAGRAWGYLIWQAQHGAAESRFWTLGLPLLGSAVGGTILSHGTMAGFPVGFILPVCVVAALGLLAYHVTDRIIGRAGALGTRLAELMMLPLLWLGHWMVSPTKPAVIELAFGVAVAGAATLSFRRQGRLLKPLG